MLSLQDELYTWHSGNRQRKPTPVFLCTASNPSARRERQYASVYHNIQSHSARKYSERKIFLPGIANLDRSLLAEALFLVFADDSKKRASASRESESKQVNKDAIVSEQGFFLRALCFLRS